MGGGGGKGNFKNTQGAKTTIHGSDRMKERGFTAQDRMDTKAGGIVKTQSDGARVYIKEVGPGKFNVLVEGNSGPITVLKNISKKALDRLARNYGWR